MLVRTTRAASRWILMGLGYAALFAGVIVSHVALTGVLRAAGLGAAEALTAAGAAVLALVVAAKLIFDWMRRRAHRELLARGAALGLPAGPMCVLASAVLEAGGAPGDPAAPGLRFASRLRTGYPETARRLRVEGVAIAEFEIGPDGRAHNIACVESWPSDVFFRAARRSLERARFGGGQGAQVGARIQLPFVFRIDGAAVGQRQKPAGSGVRHVVAPAPAEKLSA